MSGIIGLLYTLVVGRLTEGVASAVAHAMHPVVPDSLSVNEYTSLQQHLRPLELLLLAGAMWWGLNLSRKHEPMTELSGTHAEPENDSRWGLLITMTWALAVPTGYLLILAAMLAVVDPQGLGWTVVAAGLGIALGTAALLLAKRAQRHGFIGVFDKSDDSSGG